VERLRRVGALAAHAVLAPQHHHHEVVPLDLPVGTAHEPDLLADARLVVPELAAHLEPEVARALELLPPWQERRVHAATLVETAQPEALRLPLVLAVGVDGGHDRVEIEGELGGRVFVELTTLRVGRAQGRGHAGESAIGIGSAP